MKRCAYLVMDDPADFVTDYHLSFDAMSELGWHVDCVPWRDPSINWDDYDAVYICTPWDYPENPDLFIEVLESIDASQAVLINSIALVHWTLEKNYLRDLEQKGGAIVPSIWFDHIEIEDVPTWFEALGSEKIVIKPAVGANAQDTYVITQPIDPQLCEELRRVFDKRSFFVQPFMHHVESEGEYSLFFIGGEYSHAILKTPEQGDFRSQEEHGAEIKSIAATTEQIEAAEKILALVEPEPAYVRADFVRDDNDDFLLMELELIEPSLYLRTDADAARRFAVALDKWFKILTRK